MNEKTEGLCFRLPENEAEIKEIIKCQSEIFKDGEAFYDDLYIEIGHKNTVAAFNDGEVAGAVNFPAISFPTKEMSYTGGYIFAAWVKPEYRGRGVFRRLMESAEDIMRSRGYAFALVVPETEALFPMYEKFGYTEKVENGFPYASNREILREYNPTDDVYMIWKVYSKTHDMFAKDMEFFNHVMRDSEENGRFFAIAKNGYIVYSPRYDGNIIVWDRMERGALVDSGKRKTRALCKIFDDNFKSGPLLFNMMFEPKYDIINE